VWKLVVSVELAHWAVSVLAGCLVEFHRSVYQTVAVLVQVELAVQVAVLAQVELAVQVAVLAQVD
jgi:hypothetical protein